MHLAYTATALEELRGLPRTSQRRVLAKMEWYVQQKNPLEYAKHLVGYKAFRFRVGDYRIICEIGKDGLLMVLSILPRDKVYKDL